MPGFTITKRGANWKKGDSSTVIARGNTNSTNLTYKTNAKQRKKYKKDAKVASSFKLAYQMLKPKKEIRYVFDEFALNTSVFPQMISSNNFAEIAQGHAIDERSSAGIHMSYLHWQGTIQNNSVSKTKYIRLMVVRDAASDSATLDTLNWTNLLSNAAFVNIAVTGLQSDIRRQINRSRQQIYFDKVIKIKMEQEDNVDFSYKIKLNQNVYYQRDSPATIIPFTGRMHAVVLLCEGDNASSATTVVFSSQLRVFFKDTEDNVPRYWASKL